MSASALLPANPTPNDADIDAGDGGQHHAVLQQETLWNGLQTASQKPGVVAQTIGDAAGRLAEAHIVSSAEKPGGIGEPGAVVVQPAVANAIFAATGVQLTRVPVDRAKIAKGSPT